MKTRTIVGIAVTLGVSNAAAQTPAAAKIPIRALGAAEARTTSPLASAYSLRALSDGRVMVSDWTGRRIVLFDKTLSSSTVLADTAAGAPIQYGNRPLALLRFAGDSTVIVDIPSQSLLVLDPNGKNARIMASPRPSDLGMIANVASAFDPQGRIVYRGAARGAPPPPRPDGTRALTVPPDSGPLLRADFDTRSVDTIAKLKLPRNIVVAVDLPGGGRMQRGTANPLPVLDDFAVLSDGTIAVVRSHDYHVDWFEADGDKASSGKLPFDWRRVTDDEKQRIIDSARVAQETAAAAQAEAALKAGAAPGATSERVVAPPAGAGGRGGGDGAVRAAVDGPGMAAMTPELAAAMRAPVAVAPTDLPDYFPPIRAGLLRADLDSNLWVLPTTSAQAKDGLLYDVVNRKGELVERVQLPANRTILGFGPGVVYLGGTDDKGTFVERVRNAVGTTQQ